MSYSLPYNQKSQASLEKEVAGHGSHGVVYTKPWVVEMILDLAGYKAENNLVNILAVEPAAGIGGFVFPMVERLIDSCQRQNRNTLDCAYSLLVYELDANSTNTLRSALFQQLDQLGIPKKEAALLIDSWVRTGDYLLDAQNLPKADFVIGNPPYIRIEEMDESTAILYRMMYPTMVGRADLYIAFFEAALKQLKSSGVCAFICADRWMLNQYGAELRRFVTSGFNVESIIEMHQADAFESDVSAYPAITIIRRGKQESVVVASADTEVESNKPSEIAALIASAREKSEEKRMLPGMTVNLVSTWFEGNAPWPRLSATHLTTLKKLETEYYPLESDKTRVSIGVATGADNIFITTDHNIVEAEQLLPLAMAYDIADGELKWSGKYLINPWNHEGLVDLNKFPRLKLYFEVHRDRLQRRHINKKNQAAWYRTIDRVNHDLLKKPKLYIADIKDKLNPVLDPGGTYPHHNLYFVQSDEWDLKVLGGLLLSAIGQFFVESYGVRMRGGYLRFQAQYLRRIRVPRPEHIRPDTAADLTRAFESRDRELATRAALDVYKLDSMPGKDIYE